MLCPLRRPVLTVLLAVCVSPAYAGSGATTDTFSVFDSPDMNRVVHGRQRTLDLSRRTLGFGDASAFFGVDALSDSASHYLSSGIEWRSNTDRGPSLLRVGAMHTAARGAEIGNQTLMRAESQLDLGGRWYVPRLSLATDQLTGSDTHGTGMGGRATHVGLARSGQAGAYRVGYFRASPDFDAWGSSLVAGDRGIELAGEYGLARRWQLSNTLRVHQAGIDTGLAHGVVDQWRLAAASSPLDIGQPWRLSGQFGAAGALDDDRATPISVALASRTRRLDRWRINSAIGWYQGEIATPDDRPISGGMWSVSLDRGLRLGSLETRIEPHLALGGSRHVDTRYGGSAGIGLVFAGLDDHLAVNMDYASPGWSDNPERADMRMTLNFTQDTGAVLAPLHAAMQRLR